MSMLNNHASRWPLYRCETRGMVIAFVSLSLAFVGFLKSADEPVDMGQTLLAVFLQNKVTWLCLVIAAWHVWHSEGQTLTVRDALAMAPAWLLSVVGWGSWPWLGLALSLTWLRALTPAHQAQARIGLSIGCAIALHEAFVPMLAMIAGDAVLGLDAHIAKGLAGIFLEDISLEATTLRAASGHAVVLVWGCSSFSQLGNAVLFCWSLCSLTAGRKPLHWKTLTIYLAATAIMAVALNTLRISMMASSAELYEVVHDGSGATLFRLALLSLAASTAYGYQRQCSFAH